MTFSLIAPNAIFANFPTVDQKRFDILAIICEELMKWCMLRNEDSSSSASVGGMGVREGFWVGR
jgi:hypothetical protein